MRKVLLFACVLFCCPSLTIAQQQYGRDFRNAVWGMTVSEVKAVEKTPLVSEETKGPNTISLVARRTFEIAA
ncbi:MAG TPA: hypothetical protein DCE18_09700 [Syntrophobacteraceae bacterium]|jgi:hypothetical protein|nr:hypothetical protein [Syntrophobacteraceae bacterium]